MHFTHFSAATDVGLQRNNNEDNFLSLPFLGVWVVADGMGGHAAGEVASAVACESIKREVARGTPLSDSIQRGHKAVLEAAERGMGGTGMGSTVVALQSLGSRYEVCWVGDSRAYSYDPLADHPLQQITRDHSYVQMLVDSGAISASDVITHPEKNIITQCLGSIDLDEVDVGHVTGCWQPRQWLILCSDGLTDAVLDSEMLSILNRAESVEQATTNLIKAALNNGGRDNITIQIVASPSTWSQLVHTAVRSVRKLMY